MASVEVEAEPGRLIARTTLSGPERRVSVSVNGYAEDEDSPVSGQISMFANGMSFSISGIEVQELGVLWQMIRNAQDWLTTPTDSSPAALATERTDGDDVVIPVRVRRANLPALEKGVTLGIDDLTKREIVMQLVPYNGAHDLLVITNGVAARQAPDPVDAEIVR